MLPEASTGGWRMRRLTAPRWRAGPSLSRSHHMRNRTVATTKMAQNHGVALPGSLAQRLRSTVVTRFAPDLRTSAVANA